jgi:gamma-glutamylcyclotransferase (GGCT)/AIG2-like uncharacterized protein YtfP
MPFCDLSVFVYGTLKPGGYYWSRFCEGKVKTQTPAQIRGQLYDLGRGYPGAVFNSAGWIQGCVLEFKKAADFAAVDRLEGYLPSGPPDANEYTRLKVPAFSPKEQPLGPVWAYQVSPRYLALSKPSLLPEGIWPI